MDWVIIIVEFIFLLFCAAFFSCTETAITAINEIQYNKIKKNKTKNNLIIFLIEKKDEIVSATLIGTNFINTLSSSLITAFVINKYNQTYLPIFTAITTILIIIFAEILPKAIATYKALEITKFFSKILFIVHKILTPFIFIFSNISKFIINFFSKKRSQNSIIFSEDYLKTIIKIGLEDGIFHSGEQDLIKRAVKLHELKINDLMTEKNRIVGVKINFSQDLILKTFKDNLFSRLPVFDLNNNIIGIIHYKDFIFYKTQQKQFNINEIIREAIFVPKNLNIFSAIKIMNKNKKNMLFIIDEYGNIEGLITIDDITTTIFGSIQDEHIKSRNTKKDKIQIIDDSKILISADIPLVTMNELFNLNLTSKYSNTLGGLILEKFEYLPKKNEIIKIQNINFNIEKVENNKITYITTEFSKK